MAGRRGPRLVGPRRGRSAGGRMAPVSSPRNEVEHEQEHERSADRDQPGAEAEEAPETPEPRRGGDHSTQQRARDPYQ